MNTKEVHKNDEIENRNETKIIVGFICEEND